MIRSFVITVADFVRAFLPPHMRQTNRLALFRALAAPFATMSTDWDAFRDASITAVNVTGETASLQWYLNQLYDPTLRRIVIETAPPAGVVAGLTTETTLYLVAGLTTETPPRFVSAGLPSEAPVFGLFDFIVKRPAALTSADAGITKTTNSYRAAGKLFKIVDL